MYQNTTSTWINIRHKGNKQNISNRLLIINEFSSIIGCRGYWGWIFTNMVARSKVSELINGSWCPGGWMAIVQLSWVKLPNNRRFREDCRDSAVHWCSLSCQTYCEYGMVWIGMNHERGKTLGLGLPPNFSRVLGPIHISGHQICYVADSKSENGVYDPMKLYLVWPYMTLKIKSILMGYVGALDQLNLHALLFN